MSELAEYESHLTNTVQALQDDPANPELLELKEELEGLIKLLKDSDSPSAPAVPEPDRPSEPETGSIARTPVAQISEPEAPEQFPIGSQVDTPSGRGRVVAIDNSDNTKNYVVKMGTKSEIFQSGSLSIYVKKASKQSKTAQLLDKSQSKWQKFSAGSKPKSANKSAVLGQSESKVKRAYFHKP